MMCLAPPFPKCFVQANVLGLEGQVGERWLVRLPKALTSYKLRGVTESHNITDSKAYAP